MICGMAELLIEISNTDATASDLAQPYAELVFAIKAVFSEQLAQSGARANEYFDCDTQTEADRITNRAISYLLAKQIPIADDELIELSALTSALRGEPTSVRGIKQRIAREEFVRMCHEGQFGAFLRELSEPERELMIVTMNESE